MIEFLRELIEGGFIGQAVIASLVTIGIVVMSYQGKQIPEFLIASWGLIVGWFFRSQAQIISEKRTAQNHIAHPRD